LNIITYSACINYSTDW